jgi:hypothetical protein
MGGNISLPMAEISFANASTPLTSVSGPAFGQEFYALKRAISATTNLLVDACGKRALCLVRGIGSTPAGGMILPFRFSLAAPNHRRPETSVTHDGSGENIWRQPNITRRRRVWNTGLAQDPRNPEFAREFPLAAIEQAISSQHARSKVVPAMGVKEFAAKIVMRSPNLLRVINPHHTPKQRPTAF